MDIKRIDKIIRENVLSGMKIVVWGYGKLGKEFVDQTTLRIDGIFDSFAKEENNVLPSSELEKWERSDTVVIIATYHDKEICKQLSKLNFDYWISLPYVMADIEFDQHIEHPVVKSCMIETSSVCNAKCAFCANPSMKRKKSVMTEQIFDKVIERLKEAKQCPEIFWLHLCGEPLLDTDIFNKIVKLKDQFPDSSVGYATNFEIATPKMISKIFESNQDFIVISVNAIEKKDYESVMGLSWDRLCANLDMLIEQRKKRKSNLDITVSIVKTDKNEKYIDEFCSRWEHKGIKVRILKQGKWLKENSEVLEPDRGYFKKIFSGPLCQQIYQEVSIFSDGAYALCCFDSEGIYNMGNVMDTSIDELFHMGIRKKIGRKLLNGSCDLDICRECSFACHQ